MDFNFRAAIRSCNGQFECPDEDPGCPGTAWALCAITTGPYANRTTSQQVQFLTCWDDQKGKDWEANAKQCAAASGQSFDWISECAKGSLGSDLRAAAALTYSVKFPHNHCGGIFGVPHIEINGKVQTRTTYDSLLDQLCSDPFVHDHAAACRKVEVV